MQATVMPTVNLLKKLHKQALAIDGHRGTKRANQQGNLTTGRNGTAVQFFSSLLIRYRKTAGMSSLREDTPADSTAKDHAPDQKTSGASLIPRLLRSDFSTRNASEDQCIRHCIAPNAVRAVDAAGDFARRVEAFNRFAVDVHHLRLGVDLQAAHRMVNRRRHDRRPVRTFIKTMLGQAGAAAELVALLHLAELISRGNRLHQVSWINEPSAIQPQDRPQGLLLSHLDTMLIQKSVGQISFETTKH